VSNKSLTLANAGCWFTTHDTRSLVAAVVVA